MKKSRETAPVSFHAGHTPIREKPMRTIIVEHPIYGRFKAVGVRDKLQAVQAAAKSWTLQAGASQRNRGDSLQWSKIAKECTFTEGRAEDALDRSG